jgi:hypothetical protein
MKMGKHLSWRTAPVKEIRHRDKGYEKPVNVVGDIE